ncbi:MAG: radical SAM family heme chaperone HemW [Rhodocyclaceae bacterium]
MAFATGPALPPPLSLYIHFPWCVRKCPYCDFNSHESRGEIPEQAYLDALIADLDCALPQIAGRSVETVFIGGGTPSLISSAGLTRLLRELRSRIAIKPGAEITLEANPGTVSEARLGAFREAGISRLSLGVQSFEDARLTAIGRIHDAREAREAVEAALAHFDEVNIDLMYGLPGQGEASARRDFAIAAACGVPHVSAYQLSIEANTAFGRAPPALPGEDACADMQAAAEDRFASAGLVRYEISAFARPGHECRHNLNYWRFGDYLGLGAGAHGKRSSPRGIVRELRVMHPRRYLEAAPRFVQSSRSVARAELPFEFMMNALRLAAGVEEDLFAARTGLALEEIEPVLRLARERGLMLDAPGRLGASALGTRFLNDLLQLFLPEAPA